MALAPLLAAAPPVQIHVAAALALVPLTALQFVRRKGGAWHRRIGWVWIGLMAVTALSSFWINHIRVLGPFSPIHLLSIVSLVTLVFAVRARRAGRIEGHKRAMLAVTSGWALAGIFTLVPGRIMNLVAFG